MQAAARRFITQGSGGVIINISSVHEDLPMVGNAVYCAAKGGLRMLTRTLAPELARNQIRIVNVGRGPWPRRSTRRRWTIDRRRRRCLAEIPLARIGNPDDVAAAVAWLASDDASYVTGTTLFIDGGLMVSAGGAVRVLTPGPLSVRGEGENGRSLAVEQKAHRDGEAGQQWRGERLCVAKCRRALRRPDFHSARLVIDHPDFFDAGSDVGLGFERRLGQRLRL